MGQGHYNKRPAGGPFTLNLVADHDTRVGTPQDVAEGMNELRS
jgi:hypothetical protein